MIGSLFSGIGGLELGLERAGLGAVTWQVECDPFCLRVLARHWPHAKRFDDVQTVGAANLLPVDGICGGFPCQDVSSAGRRAGLDGARSGLWFEYRRLVEELRPRWCVVENVTSGERAWLPRVQHDLVSLGYRTEAVRLGAVDVGAPHRRLRTFVLAVANASGERWQRRAPEQSNLVFHDGGRLEGAGRSGPRVGATPALQSGDLVGNPDAQRQHQPQGPQSDQRRRTQDAGGGHAQCPMGRDADGIPGRLDGHRWPAGRGQEQEAWEPPRVAGRGEIPENAARLRALGNSVVPQVAEMVGRRLLVALEAP